MKKLRQLNELQQAQAVAVSMTVLGLFASTALLAHSIDFMSAVFITVSVMSIGALGSAVVALTVKDIEVSRVVSKYSAHLRKVSDSSANKDQEIEWLREELSDSEHREKIASGDLARMREINNGLQAEHRASVSRIEVLLAKVREQEFTRLQLSKINDKLTAQIDEQETEIDTLAQSRNDWREAYDKLRNGESKYTHSASTALVLGTLDKGYLLNGETVYPLS